MIERSQDYRRIKRLVPEYVISSEVYYLIETDGQDLGVWTFAPYEDGALMHADMKPECRGKMAKESGKAALRWMFENTPFRKIYAKTKVKAAQFMAVSIGMRFLYCKGGWRHYSVEV